MFIILPLAAFALLYLLVSNNLPDKTVCWRGAFLISAIIWGLIIVASTELLNVLNLISWGPVVLLWLTICLILSAYTLRSDALSKAIINAPPGRITSKLNYYLQNFAKVIAPSLRRKNERLLLPGSVKSLTKTERLFITAIILNLSVIGIIALVAPPNTYDSLTYHMSRVMHWIQNRSLQNFPTRILRQIMYTPWSEYAILHLQVLRGSDQFANLVQWFSMTGSILGISLIAGELKAARHVQILTAVTAVTLPMGILQGSSTQNDYVVTFWLVCFVYFTLRYNRDPVALHLVALASALGLALLTKVMAYIYAAPFLIWLSMTMIRKKKWRSWQPLMTLAGIVLLINMGYFLRNFDLFGHPLTDPGTLSTTTTRDMTIALFISNIIRNICVNFGTVFSGLNIFIEKSVYWFHWFYGINIADLRSTFWEYKFNLFGPHFHEDHAANPAHVLLLVICVIVYLFSKSLKRNKMLNYYTLTVIGMFLTFCFFIKWNPWITRFHLTMLIFSAPIIAMAVTSRDNQSPGMFSATIGAVLIILSLPWLFSNASRGIIKKSNIFNTSRLDQYFTNRKVFKESFLGAVDVIKKNDCSQIGLIVDEVSWVYPLWILYKENDMKSMRMEHVNVENGSRKYDYPLGPFEPCVIIDAKITDAPNIAVNNKEFSKNNEFFYLNVFTKNESRPKRPPDPH